MLNKKQLVGKVDQVEQQEDSSLCPLDAELRFMKSQQHTDAQVEETIHIVDVTGMQRSYQARNTQDQEYIEDIRPHHVADGDVGTFLERCHH